MKALMRWMVGIVGAILVVGTLGVPQAWAGTGYVDLQGGQAEAPSVTPCTITSGVGSNTSPYQLPVCALASTDTTIFHFAVPPDFNPTTSSNAVIVELTTGDWGDGDVSGTKGACWKASITVFDPATPLNYTSTSLQAVAQTLQTSTLSTGLYTPMLTDFTLVNFYKAGGGVCGTGCANFGAEAILKLQRVAVANCTTQSIAELSSAVGVIKARIKYAN
jgi:hypothetical protein